MGRNTIKGLTVEIGGDTTKLGKALENVNKKSSSLSSELGDINRLLKLDPGNTELLAQKQKVLAAAISNTEEKLNTLREAERQVQAQFEKGEVSEAQYRELQREIIATEGKLDRYKKAAQEAEEASEKLAGSSGNVTRKLDQEAEKAKEAEKATSDLGDASANAAKHGLTALTAAAGATIASVVALSEVSREHRKEMGKLDASYISNGHSSEVASSAYKELQSIIGETDQSVEAAQQIALLADSEKNVGRWADYAAGLVGKFGDALQPETFYESANETIKLGEATGAYTQMLEGCGFSVEEFNEGLAACTSETEKQEYMLAITEKALGSAAKQYKKTNSEVIRANKTNEKWNNVMAEAGGVVEPVITDIKELGITLAEDAQEPLRDVANFVRTKFLPAVTSIGNWSKQNLPEITASVAGIAAMLVTYKTAVLASELATKGLTIATVAQQVAQAALNVVMAAGPWGLFTAAIVGITAALAVLTLTTKDASDEVDVLTKAERELMAAADETAASFRKQQEDTKEALGGIASESMHVQDLATELQGLADASGAVHEADQARASFILNELNAALDTEYTMVDGVIQQYDDLKTSINDVIQSKLANSLMEASNADYVAAIQAENDAMSNVVLTHKDYETQLAAKQQAEEAYEAFKTQYLENVDNAVYASNSFQMQSDVEHMESLRQKIEDETLLLDEKKAAYENAATNYGNYANTIADYEEAQTAVLQGNYDRAVQILAGKGQAFGAYSEKVDAETAAVIDALFKEAVDAGIEAERTKKNFEDGIDGYTEEMVKEAEQGYADALDAYASAYSDAKEIGSDMGSGLGVGLENKRSSLYSKAKSIVNGIISTMRSTADSHSPARKTIDFGEDVGEGAEIGIENKTEDVRKAATAQASAILDAYNSQEIAGQNALRSVADRQVSAYSAKQMTAATVNSNVLDRILTAIEAGQVLLLDGDALVGGTADRYNNKLGQMRALAVRGAL